VRLSLTVVDPGAGLRSEVVVDTAPETPVRELALLLAERALGDRDGHVVRFGRPNATPELFLDGRRLDPVQSVGQTPLREGAQVSLDSPAGCLPLEPTGVVELRVVSGPDSGGLHRLGPGRVEIGSGQAAGIRLADPELPQRALALTVTMRDGCTLRLLGEPAAPTAPAAPTGPAGPGAAGAGLPTLEGVALDPAARAETPWPLGAQLAIGNSLLELVAYQPPDAALHPGEDGATLDYNRPPRLLPPDRRTQFKLPSSPGDRENRPLPLLMMVLPLVAAVAMAELMHEMDFLLMAFMSPVMMLGNWFQDRKQGRKSHSRQVAEYRDAKAAVEADAQAALVAERLAGRGASPDAAAVLGIATGPRTRLWERRRTDPDHLLLRFGTADLPSAVVVDDPEQLEHRREVVWEVPDAPVAMSLRQHGVLGVAGPDDTARALGRWIVAQLATLHAPADVQVCLLTDASGAESWDWLRWLPHLRPTEGQDTVALLGVDAETVALRVAELLATVTARQKALAESGQSGGGTFAQPDLVLLLDGSRRLRSLPGVVQLLREGPAVGVYAVCLDVEERFLPGECQAVVVVEPLHAPVHPSAAGAGFSGIWSAPAPRAARDLAGGDQLPAGFGPRPGAGFNAAVAAGFGPPGSGFTGNGLNGNGLNGSGFPGVGRADAVPAFAQPSVRLRVQQAGLGQLRGIRPDLVSPAWCARLARGLSPVRDVSGEAEDSAIPNSSRLLDVLGLEPPTGDAIALRWRAGGSSTTAVIGESFDGPFAIDLRRDGPHGLIAGTTGSGKSELLQTIVASLAVANTPEAMTFVLVDYKGGSAFKDCVQLPHTVGMVTDLDAHLVERALESLGAELKRREHILADAGAKDIEDFDDLRKRDAVLKPLPRLLIVIDEFASMVRELPDFVAGLVNIAQRGRSLGIHLLLATQRPSGVVSPEIRANTNLRIALRVTDASESSDVIDAPDAGYIAKSTPGRAYVRLGHTSLVPFQSGRVGGRRPGAAGVQTVRPWCAPLDWEDLGRPAPARPSGPKAQDDAEITDLKVLVDAVRAAGTALAIPAQHSPWLPALPDTMLLDEIPAPPAQGPLPFAAFGVDDLPGEQRRRACGIDFATFGHMLVAGAPRSGRSQLLRTLAGSLARTNSVRDVHLYGIDCGNGALNVLTRLPHCGAVVSRTQPERAVRLIGRLASEVIKRQEVLAAGGFADIGEQRGAVAEADRLPHTVLLLDRWEGFIPTLGEIDNGALTDTVYTLLREGQSVGVHVVVTGDRTVLSGRISTLTEEKIAFRLADRSDFSLAGIPPRKVPDEIVPGRGFRAETAIETHVALLSEDSSGQGQAQAIAGIAELAVARDADVPRARRPFRVDVLPSRIGFDEAMRLAMASGVPDSPLWGLVGVGGDELVGCGPDLASGQPTFIVGGPSKSGRSTLLMSLARTFLARGAELVVAAPRSSPLRTLAGRPGVRTVFDGQDIPAEEFTAALEQGEGPVVVLVDDAELLKDCDAKAELRQLIQRGGERGQALVIGGDAEEIGSGFSGWQVDAKKGRRGALLSPQGITNGELLGVRLPRSSVGGQITPGRAVVHLGDGELLTVQVPLD